MRPFEPLPALHLSAGGKLLKSITKRALEKLPKKPVSGVSRIGSGGVIPI
jgi:hypothetical protein